MQTVIKSFKLMMHRIFFITFIFAVVAIAVLINRLNPLPILVRALLNQLSVNWIENAMIMIDELFYRNHVIFYVLIALAICIGLSLAASFLLSGFFYRLSRSVQEPRERVKVWDLIHGFLHYFVRLFIAFFILTYSVALLLFCYTMMLFPALLIGRIGGTGEHGDLFFEFFLLVTLIVFYLLALFLRAYFMYMIPACFATRQFFSVSLRVAKKSFFRSCLAVIVTDVVLIGVASLNNMLASPTWSLIYTVAIYTVFWTFFVMWLFHHFDETVKRRNISLE